MSTYQPYVPGTPAPEAPPRDVRRTSRCRTDHDAPGVGLLVVPTVICVTIWLFTGGGYFWPMWVMLGTGIPVVLGGLARLDRRQMARRGHCPTCGR